MMPLGDDNSGRKTFPVVTVVLILLNILFFLVEMSGGEAFIIKWAFIPSRFLANPTPEIPTIFTAMFMHGGFMHIFGNMLYLWIFGDNIEDRFGHWKFLIFYLICGVSATLSQMWITPESSIPNVGASGAIAGVLGAYLILFPKSQVRVLLGNGTILLPSLIVIGFWFALQLLGQVQTVGQSDVGGVAYMAHIGGFIAGFLIAVATKISTKRRG